jgi:hypothetical protein
MGSGKTGQPDPINQAQRSTTKGEATMTKAQQIIKQIKADLAKINETPSYEALVEKYGHASVLPVNSDQRRSK